MCFLKRFHTFWGCCRATSSDTEEQDLGSPDLAVLAPASSPVSLSSAFLPWLISREEGGSSSICSSHVGLQQSPVLAPSSHSCHWCESFLPRVWSRADWIPPPPSSLLQHLHFPMWQVVPYSRVFSHSCPSTWSALEDEQALSSPLSGFSRSSTAHI